MKKNTTLLHLVDTVLKHTENHPFIFTAVCNLIIECEQRIFTDGVKMGVTLIRELNE